MLSTMLFIPSISLIPKQTVFVEAARAIESDVSEKTLKDVISQAASELDWSVDKEWVYRYRGKNNISPLEYGPHIWGPRLVEFHLGAEEILNKGISYGLSFRVTSGDKTGKDVLPTANSTALNEGPYRIYAFQNEPIAKDYIQQRLSKADKNNIHDFHGYTSLYSDNSILWQADRFIFIVDRNWSGTTWDKKMNTTKEQIAETLYRVALSKKLISDTGDSLKNETNLGDNNKPRILIRLYPTFFQKVGDSVDFSVTLKDSNGNVVPGESVSLINLNNQIKVDEKITDAKGNAVFVLIYDDPDVVNYTYEVKSMGINKAVQIPVAVVNIDLEINPETDLPFDGIVADGKSKLKLYIQLSGMTSGDDFRITQAPDFGTLEGKALLPDGVIDLNSANPVIYFVPPVTLPTSMISRRDESLNCGFAVSSFIFTYTSIGGDTLTFPYEIAIYRPQIFLLHDENNTTLETLLNTLKVKQFDTRVVENSTIIFDGLTERYMLDQTNYLRQSIQNNSSQYSEKNIKFSCVDVIAHGIGGLIARSYCNNPDSNIRKLIMLGTPNHGFSWSHFQVLNIKSYFKNKTKFDDSFKLSDEFKNLLSFTDKYCNQSIPSQLNIGEATGAHLNNNIEYGNIFSYSPELGFFNGDAFVSSASAYLNGVETYVTEGNTHSILFNALGIPITEDILVFSKIQEWLDSPIQKPDLRTMRTHVTKAEGNVFLKAQDILEKQKIGTPLTSSFAENTAIEIKTFETLITEKGKAVVTIYMNEIPWGYIFVDEDTEIMMEYSSPTLTQVSLIEGEARFTTFHIFDMGYFSVDLQTHEDWTNITGLETDFIANSNANAPEVTTYVINGNAIFNSIIENANSETQKYLTFAVETYPLKKHQGIQYSKSNGVSRPDLPKNKWWKDSFYSKNTIGWLYDYSIQIFYTYKAQLAHFSSELDVSSLTSMLPKAFSHYKTVVFVFGLVFIVFVMLMNAIFKEKWLRLLLIPFAILAVLFFYTYVQSSIILKLL